MTYALRVETSLPRPGRRFEPTHELQLHAAALRSAEALPGAARGLVVVPEFAGPLGVPDFTAFVGNPECLVRRHRSKIAPVISEIDAGIVSVAHTRRPSSAGDLAQALGWPESVVVPRLRRLVSAGGLQEPRSGIYTRPAVVTSYGRLYAIEAKIEDWRKALRQARTYRVWADGYVVVMTGLTERATAALLAEVRHDRGGLIVDGKWLCRPRITEAPLGRRLQAIEMFAAATGTGLNDPALTPRVHA